MFLEKQALFKSRPCFENAFISSETNRKSQIEIISLCSQGVIKLVVPIIYPLISDVRLQLSGKPANFTRA